MTRLGTEGLRRNAPGRGDPIAGVTGDLTEGLLKRRGLLQLLDLMRHVLNQLLKLRELRRDRLEQLLNLLMLHVLQLLQLLQLLRHELQQVNDVLQGL